jgi:nitrate reductase gamma subunit
MFKTLITPALLLAGAVQIGIALSSLAIPRVLGWRAETARLSPLTRQVFWTYAGYILGTNICFGVFALVAPRLLTDRSTLASALTGYIAVYWLVRVILQFTVFDRRTATTTPLLRAAEALYGTAFAYLALVYASATAFNVGVLS